MTDIPLRLPDDGYARVAVWWDADAPDASGSSVLVPDWVRERMGMMEGAKEPAFWCEVAASTWGNIEAGAQALVVDRGGYTELGKQDFPWIPDGRTLRLFHPNWEGRDMVRESILCLR